MVQIALVWIAGSCVRPRMVRGPCGELLQASKTPTQLSHSVRVGEVAVYVSSPWIGQRLVRLDSGSYVKPDHDQVVRFVNVTPGTHVLRTVVLGFEPQVDTTVLGTASGVFVVIVPRRKAPEVCTGPSG